MKHTATIQPDLFSGAINRDLGIARAEQGANNREPGWSDKAFEMFCDWLKGWPRGYEFLTEDFRLSAEVRGLQAPKSKRVYGALAVKAKKAGLIQAVGVRVVKNPDANMCYATLWRKI